MTRCINWPCALPAGHKGPCDSMSLEQQERSDARRWTPQNCPDHHYRAMGRCPYCGETPSMNADAGLGRSEYVCDYEFSEFANALAICVTCGWPIGRHRMAMPELQKKGPFKTTEARCASGSTGRPEIASKNPDIREDTVRQARDTLCDASSFHGGNVNER